MPSATIESGQTYTGVTFKKLNARERLIIEAVFTECTFVRCEFSETQFRGCRFINCRFDDCVMKMTRVPDSTVFQTAFRQCNLLGINWSELNTTDLRSKTSSLQFDTCILQYSIFFGLDLKTVKMTACDAREVNFAEAVLVEADFTDTDFAGAVFLRADLTRANFVGAKNYTISIRDNKTTGTRFALPEALRLLYAVDLVIVDPVTHHPLEHADPNSRL